MISGTGVDIIEIERIEGAIKRWGDLFLEHVYTADEIRWARAHKIPAPHFAGRFAAKEAIFKALGDPRVSWLDLNIINEASGQPVCRLKKRNFTGHIFLSISHSRTYAVAQAIVTR